MNTPTSPTTLDEVVDLLVKQTTEEDKNRFSSQPNTSPYFFAEMPVRSSWELWVAITTLQRDFIAMKTHLDDQKDMIFAAFRARLRAT
jgi:hypothetical protein